MTFFCENKGFWSIGVIINFLFLFFRRVGRVVIIIGNVITAYRNGILKNFVIRMYTRVIVNKSRRLRSSPDPEPEDKDPSIKTHDPSPLTHTLDLTTHYPSPRPLLPHPISSPLPP